MLSITNHIFSMIGTACYIFLFDLLDYYAGAHAQVRKFLHLVILYSSLARIYGLVLCALYSGDPCLMDMGRLNVLYIHDWNIPTRSVHSSQYQCFARSHSVEQRTRPYTEMGSD